MSTLSLTAEDTQHLETMIKDIGVAMIVSRSAGRNAPQPADGVPSPLV
jgi:hypothetical protein